MIKAIIFDFFGVLVTEGFKKFRDENFPNHQEKWRQAIDLVNRHDSGEITKLDFIKGMASISGKSFDQVAASINKNLPNKQLLGYIKTELKPKYKISILSNSGDDYTKLLLAPDDVKMFDDIVLSYRFKIIKPQPEIFELAAQRLGVQPQECLFVDDSNNHCAGAQKVGMKTIFYQDFPSFKQKIEQVLEPVSDN
jgi:putative hydrolase of the HAD superfamily